MKSFISLVAATLAVLVPRCHTIHNPIHREVDEVPRVAADLDGTWEILAAAQHGMNLEIVVEPDQSNGHGKRKLSIRPKPRGFPEDVSLHVVEVNGSLYIDATVDKRPSWGHHFYSLEIAGESQLRLRKLLIAEKADAGQLEQHKEHFFLSKSGRAGIPIPLSWTDAGTRVTATTRDLRQFLRKDIDESLYGPALTLSRVAP